MERPLSAAHAPASLRLGLASLGLVFVGLVWAVPGLREGSGARGEEATHRLMTESLLAERDLIFDHRDVQRGTQLWPQGPGGLVLLSPDDGRSFRYARPLAYALAALPFRGLLGEAGFYLLNLVALGGAWWLARRELGREEAGRNLLLVGFCFASAVFGFAFRVGPEALCFALVTGALLAGRRFLEGAPTSFPALPASAGLLLGVAVSLEPLSAVALAVVGVDALVGGRWRQLAILLLAVLLGWGGLATLELRLQGTLAPAAHAEARRFGGEVPIEGRESLWRDTIPEARQALLRFPRSAASWVHEVGYLAGGRSGGLLPFYPFALLALGLSLGGSWERQRWLPALGLLVGLALLVGSPAGQAGGVLLSGLGDPRLPSLVPLALLLPARSPGKGHLSLAFLAAGLFTLPALVASLGPARASAPGALALLPLELSRLGAAEPGAASLVGVPGYRARTLGEAVWLLPQDRFFVEENNPRGVWMKGASEAEVIVVAPGPLERLELVAVALADDNELRLEGGAGVESIRFDTAGKRAGAPVSLPLAPVARNLGAFFPQEVYYRLRLSCSSGVVPARQNSASQDARYLGAFLDFGFEGE